MSPRTEQDTESAGGWLRTTKVFLRGLTSQLSRPMLILCGLLAIGAISLQTWVAVSLSRDAVENTGSETNRLVARTFAERLSRLPAAADSSSVSKALDEISRLNPGVRPYIVNEHGIVVVSPSGLGKTQLPFVDRRLLVGLTAPAGLGEMAGDDPHNLRLTVPVAVAPFSLRGERHFVYVVLAPASTARSGFMVNSETWLWALAAALVTSGLIAVVLLFVAHRRVQGLQSSVAALSHDLRAPLSSIQGYLETILQRGEALAKDDSKRFMSVALRSTRSATNMVNDLHHLSLLEASGQTIVMEPVSIVDLVMDTLTAVRPAADEKRITLAWSIPPRVPLVNGNAALLERLVRNLVENAIRYTPKNGAVEAVFEVLADSVRVTITDSGVGIPEQELGKVSRTFFRGSKTKASVQGSGVGLSVSTSIAKLHGSQLRILSREREGTAVIFELSQAEQRYH